MKLISRRNLSILVPCVLAIALLFSNSSCGVHYGFRDRTGIPDSIKTVKVDYIDNRARYINPQLSPKLTDKLRQKIISQTKLQQTNSDNADWQISAYINDYSFSTSGISNQQVVNNRLTVGVHITLNDRKSDNVKDYDVSRSFEFKGSQSIQQAEAALLDEMTRTLTDEIFNKLFSNW